MWRPTRVSLNRPFAKWTIAVSAIATVTGQQQRAQPEAGEERQQRCAARDEGDDDVLHR
jgi:hypothetical protein